MLFVVLFDLHQLFHDETGSPLQPDVHKPALERLENKKFELKSASHDRIELGETSHPAESVADNQNIMSSRSIDPSNTSTEDCPNGVIRVGIRGSARISGTGGCVYPSYCDDCRFSDPAFMRIKTNSKNVTFVDKESDVVVPLGHSRGEYWARDDRAPQDTLYFKFDGKFELVVDLRSSGEANCSSVCVSPVGADQCKDIKIQDITNYTWEMYKHIWIVTIIGAIAITGFIVYRIVTRVKFCLAFSRSSDSGTASLGETLL